MVETVTTFLKEKGFQRVQNFEEITSRFIEVARRIMCSHELVYGDRERAWRITALELYLHTGSESDVWQDPYTHGAPAQLESGTWYVHDNGTRAPFYSGIDITCGSSDLHGGLLIRELDTQHRWVFQRIVRGANVNRERTNNTWSVDEKRIIQQSIHGSQIGSGLLRLVETPSRNEQLFIGPRIGLKKKAGEDASSPEKVAYRTASLRIATSPTECLKTSMRALASTQTSLVGG
jgi:hypothetical protein